MAYDYSDLVQQAQQWAQQTVNERWLAKTEVQVLLSDEIQQTQTIFTNNEARPLVVAFLGGTGVGKSTLLNRLAAKDIAKTGVVRPTSKEVTLFHHKEINISQLPEGFPLEKIIIAEHSEDQNKHIIWMDMPDFDSTEASNQDIVLDWLPHIDVLIYVVSPERYRDNKAWQLLLAEGGKHAWVFVLNQSDRAQTEQYQDFILQLNKAGFDQPLVYQSCCLADNDEGANDEFIALQEMMQSLATEKTVKQLAVRSEKVRKQALIAALSQVKQQIGAENSQQNQLNDFWQTEWHSFERLLKEAMVLPIQQLAQSYALNSSDLAKQSTNHELWDTWAQTRFLDALDGLVLQADAIDLPVNPLRLRLDELRSNVKQSIQDLTLLEVRKSLIKPGNVVQRSVLKIAGIAEIILPISAMGWVGYQAFMHFYKSSLMDTPQYLGTNFAINSVMLIAIVWLFPYFLQKKLQPSLEKAAVKGLQKGVDKSLQKLNLDVLASIGNYEQQRQIQHQQVQKIIGNCVSESAQQIDAAESSDLTRMLLP